MGRTIVLGDERFPFDLTSLDRRADGADTAIVWATDLREVTETAAAKQLARATHAVTRLASTMLDLRRIVVVYVRARSGRSTRLARAAARLAKVANHDLERRRGYSTDVVFLDATGCEDAGALRSRLHECADGNIGLVLTGDVLLSWDEIRHRTVRDVVLERDI
ncbi:hypothetical protein GCM10022202_36710 [Microbacterium marinilacus]|uniref:Resolvase/invertase-type recombinase catalytic domain-containing protein n=2 Tax=Microbacterium marinilacus TaxID=415209 RepID=A0ABP7BXU8_9MICO